MSTTLRCLIIDDEPLAIRLLKAHVTQIPQLELLATFTNPLEAMAFMQQNHVDLLFLDIQMPTLTGLDLVRSLSPAPRVIFTTAYREYAVESYELEVVDYLVKPITFPRFLKAVQRCSAPVVRDSPTSLSQSTLPDAPSYCYVNANKKYIRIDYADITHVESVKDYIRIHTDTQRIVTKQSLTAFAGQLPDHFLRIHRSFLVNLDRVTAFTAQDVEIGTLEIPIGGHYKQGVLRRLQG